MSTHMPGFQSFSVFLHHFILAKLANSSIRVKDRFRDFAVLRRAGGISCQNNRVNKNNRVR